jgi:dTMP kinase
VDRGRLITIEGIDGAGKTTLARGLHAELRERGVHASLLREPGGVPLSERIRGLVADASLEVSPHAEALLYAAARAELVQELVLPALSAGRWVLLDRFVDSSLAYQGGGRRLGIEQIRALNEFATGGLAPDRTLLLALDVASALRRRMIRADHPDRLELEHEEFFRRVDAAYQILADAEPERIRRLDASRSPEQLLTDALAALSDLL